MWGPRPVQALVKYTRCEVTTWQEVCWKGKTKHPNVRTVDPSLLDPPILCTRWAGRASRLLDMNTGDGTEDGVRRPLGRGVRGREADRASWLLDIDTGDGTVGGARRPLGRGVRGCARAVGGSVSGRGSVLSKD